MRNHAFGVVFALSLTALPAQGALQISIGVRETGFAGSLVGTIGDNGGTGGGIEWINRDGQTLPVDGEWHTFTFDFAVDPVLGFAGTSANSILEGTYGVLEHIRVLNSSGIVDPIVLLIDDVTDTTTTTGPVNFGDFETYTQGAAAMFREAGFSGSTAANLMTGSTAGVETVFPGGTIAYGEAFQFVDSLATRWARITTFNLASQGNPVVRFDDNSVVSFRLLAYTKTLPDLGSQGPGNATAALVGEGLNASQLSTVHAGFAPGNSVGAMLVSLANAPSVPVLGGTVVSGSAYLFAIPMFADANGHASLTLTGDPTIVNFALQGIFLDNSLPGGVAFTNAVEARFGQ